VSRIPDETIRAIRDRTDIVELVGRYITLRKAGRNYKGLCPFHSEKTPSFNVRPDHGTYHCFGCGEGGSAFDFLMRHDNLTFPEAARSLARDCGIEIAESTGRGESGVADGIAAANEVAQRFYRASFSGPQGAAARDYLARRGVDDASAAHVGIGFAPAGWDGVVRALAAAGIPAEKGARAGLLRARDTGGHYDLLRGRITFPIQDARERILGFGGRALSEDQQPKYLNTPESPIYRKRESFYGFPHALEAIRRKQRVVVVEGYFDRIALHRAGIEESVASCGTALTSEHAHNLGRRAREVILLFDGDEAGRRATESALEVLLAAGLRVRAAALPAGEDPDTLLAREGAAALLALVDAARPAIEGVVERAVRRGCATAWEKDDAVSAVSHFLALVQHPVERAQLVTYVSRATTTSEKQVEAAVRAAATGRGADLAAPSAPRRMGPEERHLRSLASALLEFPEHASRVAREEFQTVAPASPCRDLIVELLDETAGGKELDVVKLAARLEPETSALLYSIAASEPVVADEAAAIRTIDDTMQSLCRRHGKRQRSAVLQRFGVAESGSPRLIDAMQPLVERRRSLERGASPGASGRAESMKP
jgi:DNA primase